MLSQPGRHPNTIAAAAGSLPCSGGIPFAIWAALRRAAVMGHHHARFTGMMVRRVLGRPINRQPSADTADPAAGLTIVLPGIEASGPYVENIYHGLMDARVPGTIRVFYWGWAFPEGYLPNLLNVRRNRAQGRRLAQMILAHQQRYPAAPVHLVANSAGIGPALFAIEELPESRSIDGLVVLAGAASNSYDLRPVLRRTRKGVLNTYSTRDFFILNLGTRLFGTVDRKFSVSCGHSGFVRPPELNGDGAVYDKLTQIRWTPEFGRLCDWWGNHGTSTSREFIRRFIAPWIVGSAPTSIA